MENMGIIQLFHQGIVIGSLILIGYIIYRIIKSKQLFGELERLQQENTQAETQWERLQREIYKYNQELIDLTQQTEMAKEKAENAEKLARQELEIEAVKRRDNYEQKLQAELEELRKNSDLNQYQKELSQLQTAIQEAKTTLDTLQAQQQQELEKEDFIETHIIKLDNNDAEDITLIRDFAKSLHNKNIVTKLIWSEFYQKPLQWLCKSLGADKTTGIYKITEITTNRMYIGQAVDIGTRWKEHVKAALGVDSGSGSSKFYRAMAKNGPENFTFEILEVCERKILNDRELYWIDFYNAVSYGFNSKTI